VRRSTVHAASLLVAILTALLAFAALAQASAGNATATRSYLRAELAQTRAEVAGLPAAIAAVEALRGRLAAECPGVLAHEPAQVPGEKPSSSVTEIEEEGEAAVFGAAEQTEYLHRRGFAHAVSRLRWGNRALTRLIHSSAAAEEAQSTIPPPDLCADLRTWVGSGFQSVSPATEAYVRRESTLTGETRSAESAIPHKLAPFENRADKKIVRQIASLEKKAVKTAAPELLAALAKVGEVLHGVAATPAA
jgi:hypothetical protein